jgi:hypothetical protein
LDGVRLYGRQRNDQKYPIEIGFDESSESSVRRCSQILQPGQVSNTFPISEETASRLLSEGGRPMPYKAADGALLFVIEYPA